MLCVNRIGKHPKLFDQSSTIVSPVISETIFYRAITKGSIISKVIQHESWDQGESKTYLL